jgi:hypothetical protein
MSELKVNKISPRAACGTVQLGDSGDTITIPAGATITNNGTQTGFGRTGAVNYQTSIKTTNFTAVSGEGYFVDTTSGAITVTLPASPSAGSIVAVVDYAGTSGNNNITLGRNGSNLEGAAADGAIATNREAKTLVYADATQGWVAVSDNTTTTIGAAYVAATGGTVTTVCTDFKVHTFTGPGTFCVSNAGNSSGSNKVSYLIVGGGGGGGYEGGGGAGGFRESRAATCSYTASPIAITGSCGGVAVAASPYAVVVGGGASGITQNAPALAKGNVSSVLGLTAAGGGGGKNSGTPVTNACGGSGGGGASSGPLNTGGAGNTPSTTPAQGFVGGNFIPAGNPAASRNTGGGGGGATARGGGLTNVDSGFGGAGASTSITGASVAYGGGGGGGVDPPSPARAGGTGGGGNGNSANGCNGTANTGGGGGGSWNNTGGNGGGGIVIIRYKFQN